MSSQIYSILITVLPTQVCDLIYMDFIGGLPKLKGKNTIFVVVDKFSKYAYCIKSSIYKWCNRYVR